MASLDHHIIARTEKRHKLCKYIIYVCIFVQMSNDLVDLTSSLVEVLFVVLFALRLFQYDGCALSFLL